MEKKLISEMIVGFFLLCMAETVHATLTTIGTAMFEGDGSYYNLIWDDDNGGNSVVWLDYTNDPGDVWETQTTWAAGLDDVLTLHLDAGYAIAWEDGDWRLPWTVDGEHAQGFDGTTTAGYNISTSEMGHLFYEDLGNLSFYSTDGTPQPGWGFLERGDFENLFATDYWSGTEYGLNPSRAWMFNLTNGYQGPAIKESHDYYGLAVRSGQVFSTGTPVPEPTSLLLIGIGIGGMAVTIRQYKRNALSP